MGRVHPDEELAERVHVVRAGRWFGRMCYFLILVYVEAGMEALLLDRKLAYQDQLPSKIPNRRD